jgi:hypothetical protein
MIVGSGVGRTTLDAGFGRIEQMIDLQLLHFPLATNFGNAEQRVRFKDGTSLEACSAPLDVELAQRVPIRAEFSTPLNVSLLCVLQKRQWVSTKPGSGVSSGRKSAGRVFFFFSGEEQALSSTSCSSCWHHVWQAEQALCGKSLQASLEEVQEHGFQLEMVIWLLLLLLLELLEGPL